MSKALPVGQPLPILEVETSGGQKTTVQAHLGQKQTLLYFLHGAWCPECVGQYHLLQRYLPRIKETGAELVVITSEESETLETFLRSAHPSLEYTVLTDPTRHAYRTIGAGDDMVAIIMDGQGIIRWRARWPEHQGEPGYEMILQALHEVRDHE